MKELTIGNYRISRCDDQNLQVEEFKTVKAKRGRFVKEARETDKWVFKGYFGCVKDACKGVLKYMSNDGITIASGVGPLLDAIADAEAAIVSALKSTGLNVEHFDKPVDGRGRKPGTVVAKKKAVNKGSIPAKKAAKKKTVKRKTRMKNGRKVS